MQKGHRPSTTPPPTTTKFAPGPLSTKHQRLLVWSVVGVCIVWVVMTLVREMYRRWRMRRVLEQLLGEEGEEEVVAADGKRQQQHYKKDHNGKTTSGTTSSGMKKKARPPPPLETRRAGANPTTTSITSPPPTESGQYVSTIPFYQTLCMHAMYGGSSNSSSTSS